MCCLEDDLTIHCIFMDSLLVVQNTVHTLGLMSRTVLET